MEQFENMKSLDEATNDTKRKFYTEHGWEGSKYDPDLSIKDIAKNIRAYVKATYPTCKFSVTTERGRAMTVALMEAPQSVFTPEFGDGHRELYFASVKDKALNEYGFSMMSDVNDQVVAYKYNDSDAMRDYFDTNFYHHMHIGKWDRDFKVIGDEIEVVQDAWIPTDEIETNFGQELEVSLHDYQEQGITELLEKGTALQMPMGKNNDEMEL